MAGFWLISLLLGVTFVQLLSAGPLEIYALNPTSNTLNDDDTVVIPVDDGLTDQICGTHPLKSIVKKIENSRKLFYFKKTTLYCIP